MFVNKQTCVCFSILDVTTFCIYTCTLMFDIFLYLSFQTRPCNIRCQKHLQNSIENLFGNSRICVGKTTHMKTRDSNNNIKKLSQREELDDLFVDD